KSRIVLQGTGDWLMSMLPDDPESTILKKLKKPKPEEDEVAPTPGQRSGLDTPTEPGGYASSDRSGMQQLIRGKPAARGRRRGEISQEMSEMAETPSDAGLDPGRGRATATSAGREASDWGEAFDGDRLREECGVFGIFGHPDAAAITALGLHALQHRGQEAAG